MDQAFFKPGVYSGSATAMSTMGPSPHWEGLQDMP